MARTNLKLNAKDGSGNDISTTINYVNPEAKKEDILEFTQALNALTRNTYMETEKITTINVDNEYIQTTSITLVNGDSVNINAIRNAGDTGVRVATFVGNDIYMLTPDTELTLRITGNNAYIKSTGGGGEYMRDLDAYLCIPATDSQTASNQRIIITA